MPPHPLNDFEIQKYYHNHTQWSQKNKTRFNCVYSRDNLPKIKDGAYVINLDKCSDTGIHWIALYVLNNVTYFDSFGVEQVPNEIKGFISDKNIKTSIFRIQAYDSIMSRYFCIGFIGFMFARKSLIDFANLFSPNNFKKTKKTNDDTI